MDRLPSQGIGAPQDGERAERIADLITELSARKIRYKLTRQDPRWSIAVAGSRGRILKSIRREIRKLYRMLDKEIQGFSQAWNLRFGNMILAKCPREIRDVVYGYLYEAVKPLPLVQNSACTTGTAHPMIQNLCLPHYMDPNYMGVQFSREMAAFWHEKTSFTIYDYRLLELFIKHDVGLLHHLDPRLAFPPAVHIRRLDLHLFFDVESHKITKDNRERLQGSREALRHVLSIERKPNFQLTLVMHTTHRRSIKHYLRNMFPLIYEFKRAGMLVDVREVRTMAGSKPLTTDWTYRFKCSEETWVKREAARVRQKKNRKKKKSTES